MSAHTGASTHRTMTAVCFVCNLPILSHQVGLVWQGGNGWDDLLREQLEESTLRARLGGRRDSAAQISCVSPPPTETRETSPPPPPGSRGQRRRSSLAQLTDLLREWGGPKSSVKGRSGGALSRRETLADLARSLPWRSSSTASAPAPPDGPANTPGTIYRKRRDSSAETRRHQRRDSHASTIADIRSDLARLWPRRDSGAGASRRGSGDSGGGGGGRRESLSGTAPTLTRQQSTRHHRPLVSRRRDSRAVSTTTVSTGASSSAIGPAITTATATATATTGTGPAAVYYRTEQRPSTSSTASDSVPPDYPQPPPTAITVTTVAVTHAGPAAQQLSSSLCTASIVPIILSSPSASPPSSPVIHPYLPLCSSTSSSASDSAPPELPPLPSSAIGSATLVAVSHAVGSPQQMMPLMPPTIITVQGTTPPATSPSVSPSASGLPPPSPAPAPATAPAAATAAAPAASGPCPTSPSSSTSASASSSSGPAQPQPPQPQPSQPPQPQPSPPQPTPAPAPAPAPPPGRAGRRDSTTQPDIEAVLSSPQPSAQPSPQSSPQPTPRPSPQLSPRPSPQPSPQLSPRPSPQPSPRPSPQPSPRPSPQSSPQPPATPGHKEPSPTLPPQTEPEAPPPAEVEAEVRAGTEAGAGAEAGPEAGAEDLVGHFARAVNASRKRIVSNWARLGRALSTAYAKWSPASTLRRVPTTLRRVPTTLRRMPTTLRRMSTQLRRAPTLRRTWTVYGKGRAGASPERRSSTRRLTRQDTAIDDSPYSTRRGSQPTLAPDDALALAGASSGLSKGKGRRDSLSPDSAHGGGAGGGDDGGAADAELGASSGGGGGGSGGARERRRRGMRRPSTSVSQRGRASRSPESTSSCSSRDASPRRGSVAVPIPSHAPAIRRQSTTEEILIARGFRRQSTTEEMMRCRNFRRNSSLSQEESVTRSRGRRDSSAQITDGTIASMTVETTSTFFDSSTQTDPSPLYDNNHYHEECLRCNACGLNLTGPNQARARRFRNCFFCELHFADVALMASADFMQQLRAFKPQSLGCAVARRKSSTTLIFPLPPQACSDEFCEEFPHNLIPTPGYWIECSRQKLAGRDTIWDESEENSGGDDGEEDGGGSGQERGRRRAPEGGPSLAEEEEEEDDEDGAAPRAKTAIEEQWEKHGCFELTSVEQETYEKYFYGSEHWNYFTSDEDLGPVVLSIRQETLNGRDQFRILVRAISYTVHGLIPASCVFADRYNREEVVRSLGKEVNINPPFTLGQLPDTPEELLKLDQVFIKSELKVGVIYVQEGQYSEEEILDNNDVSPLFDEFLQILGDKVRLKGFDKYKGGLDTVHDLTGLYSVYTHWRNIEIMFHVSTLLPYEKNDPQKLQRKRHIGNDIVCVVFLEADNTSFSPACIKSHFLHTFILVRTSPRIKRRPTRYEVSVVTRDEVGAYKPYLWEQSVFDKGHMFREWLLTKVVNGERASYSAPKFARMQERTRSQMLEDIVANLQNHAETGQIPKPYRRGSWRPIGHMRPSSPLLDSVRDQFEDYDSLAADFNNFFLNPAVPEDAAVVNPLFDVAFLVGQSKSKTRLCGVRAILGVRSRVFQEMLYGISTGFGSPQVPVAELLARAVPSLHSPQKPKSSNFLQVPDIESPRPKSVPSSPKVIRAFSRLGTITAGWGRSIRKGQALSADDKKKWASSQDCSNKDGKGGDKDKGGAAAGAGSQLAVPRLSVCADAQKVDRAKLAQTEFSIIEFDPDTFRVLLDYLHTGSCSLTCSNIPGLICAAEHYDLPELLQACFHHAKQFLRIEVVCCMLCSLENYYWRYTSASELVNMILAFVETRAHQLFAAQDFLQLSESMLQMVMCRQLEVPEVRKFEAMLSWARHRIRTKTSSKVDARLEFRCMMERLSRDLKLYRITPQELIKVVLPSKAIRNERILETLMFQANSGMYRVQDSYLEACQRRLQAQESRYSEWDSFDYGL